MVSGVGMHMTKHVYALYSTEPDVVEPPDEVAVQAELDAAPRPSIVDTYAGPATLAAYSVVHGRDGDAEWALAVCDVDGGRCYARFTDADSLQELERSECVGRRVDLRAGDDNVNLAHLT
jgi:acetyl-CoA C-acetyltransferase